MHLCWPRFVERDNAVLLASEVPAEGPLWSQFPDITSAEAFYNHLHVLDAFDHGAGLDGSDPAEGFWDSQHPDFVAACALGKVIAEMWHAKLNAEYPERQFRVYFTADDNPVVRFHCVRAQEPAWLDEECWKEAVAAGRIVILETPPRFPLGAK